MNRTKRNKIRRTIAFISFLLFPVTLNFFSPYVSIDGALAGVISGSVILFFIMFLTGILFRRAWCSYICPNVVISEYTLKINDKRVNRKTLTIIRYSIFAIWFGILIFSFIMAGGIQGIDSLHLTENFISVDEPLKYITYYMVVSILFLLTLVIGRRGACYSICWMSPFLVAGTYVGDALRLPQYKIVAESEKCITCGKCTKACPMSIDVMNDHLKDGCIQTTDCILCGSCVEVCPQQVFSIKAKK